MLEEGDQERRSEGVGVRKVESVGRPAPEVWIAAPRGAAFWVLFRALFPDRSEVGLREVAYKRKGPVLIRATGLLDIIPGSDLLSHRPAPAVPSAVEGLTSVFGMGTGVTLLL